MELRQLRYFQAVVEAGSITAAAAHLHMSQPPLSVAISKLESSVGVPLLVRTPRGVEPTSAGRHLLQASGRILGDVDDVTADLRRFGAGTAGTVALAAVPTLTWSRIPRLLRRYARVAPDVEVRLSDPPPWSAIDQLQERSVDIAAIMVADGERFRRRYQDTLHVVDWGEVPLVAVFPPEETELPDPLPLSALEGRTLMVPRRTAAVPSLPEAVDATLAARGIVPKHVRTVETIQTGLHLIEAGLGAGLLPDPDGESLRRFDVVTRTVEPAAAALRALVLARPGSVDNPAIGGFLGLITQDRGRDHV